ncbi:MAG: VWA domain-containing protein [Planctomycetaceae bacterium]
MERTKQETQAIPRFEPPKSFGRPPLWFDQTSHGILLFLILVLFAVVAWLIWYFKLGSTPAGDTEVTMEVIQLGDRDPQATSAAPVDPAIAKFMAAVPQMSTEANIDSVQNVAPVGSTDFETPEKVDKSQMQQDQQQSAQASSQAVDEAVARLDRMLKEGRLKKMGLRGMSGVFKIPDNVDSVIYVIDRSGSMNGRPLQLVKAELISAIEGLTEDKNFYVIFYDDFAWTMYSSQGVAMTGQVTGIKTEAATTANKQRAVNWINGMSSSGGTNPVPAMLAAIEQNPGLIYLLSDGAFAPSASQTIINANDLKREGKKIHCVGLSETPIQTLVDIADKSGGVYYAVTR